MKVRTLLIFVFTAVSVLSFTNFSYAQDEGTMLPDINPQDIEIRGEFRARFLGLDRQPILGFDPKLQVHQIDPNRMPFMEEGDQRVANLPVSELSRPAPPAYTALDNAEDINLFARAGAGSYTSPELKFWGVTSLDNGGYVGGDLDFSSSEGHLENQPSSFRFLDANAEYGARLAEKTELRVYGGVQSDFNHPVEFQMTSVPNEDGVKFMHRGFNAGAELNRFKNDVAGWKIEGNIRRFQTEIDSDVYGGSATEWAFNGSAMNRWTLGHPSETIAVEIGGRGGSYERTNGFMRDNQWGKATVGVTYERLFNYDTNVYARANAYYTRTHAEDKYYPGGLLKIDHWFGDRLKISGSVEGEPYFSSVEEIHERNRFLGFDNKLYFSYKWDVTGEASIKYYRGSKLHGGVTYSNTQDRLYFTGTASSNNTGSRVDFYQTNYQDATNFKLFAGITHQLLPERFWISGQVYIQNPELKNGDKVPFEENWGLNASVSFSPIDRITIKGWADYVGERESNINNSINTLDDFLLVGSQLDVEIVDNFGAYLKLVNITDQSYEVWQGYTERPFQVYGGLTLKF